MIEKLVRKNILSLKPYTSARDSHSEGILLDANENSLGSIASEVGNNLELNRYPDPAQKKLRAKLSEYINVPIENLFFGVGSDEIIDLLIRIFCNPGIDEVIIPIPTYGMYEVACNVNDVKVKQVPLTSEFQIDLDVIKENITDKTKMIFLCSPNNPTGNVLKKNDILKVLSIFKGIVVLDEAYIDFCEDKSLINEISNYENLVITRTFSKAWGLAGVRCGYSIAAKAITNLLFKIKAPYNINKVTAEIILNALRENTQKNEFVKKLNSEKKILIESLKKIKKVKKILPTDANFITFEIENATKVYQKLADEGIIIRNRSNQYNLGDCLRITVGTKKENELFINKLKVIIAD